VTDRDGIKLIDNDPVGDYFYWQENTRYSWIKRFGENAKLEISYTDGGTERYSIKDLAEKANIYKNSNTGQGTNTNEYGLLDWWDDNGTYRGTADFDIMTIRYPLNKKSQDLGVKIYYRGGIYDVPVDVYTTLKSVTSDPADLVDNFWPNPDWDNDVDNGDGGPLALSRRIKVTATYASPDGQKQGTYDLIYWWDEDAKKQLRKNDHIEYVYDYKAGPYYLFANDQNTREDPDEIGDDPDNWDGAENDSTYLKGYKKYLDNVKKKKYETTTKVTFLHEMDSDVITRFYAYLFGKRWQDEDGGLVKDNNGDLQFSKWGDIFDWENYDWVNGHDGVKLGVLPDSRHRYDTSDSKQAEFFGPKAAQKKKNKVSVQWVDKSVIK